MWLNDADESTRMPRRDAALLLLHRSGAQHRSQVMLAASQLQAIVRTSNPPGARRFYGEIPGRGAD